jgi:hypothetical protein
MNGNLTGSSRSIRCSVLISRWNIRGLQGIIRRLDRLGATLWLEKENLRGYSLQTGDGMELDIRLPENDLFKRRTLNAIGRVIRIGERQPDKLWVVIRFRSLQFRDVVGHRLARRIRRRGD